MEKLIKECKEFVEENPTYYGLELTVSDVKLIVEALEKQIPKKPKMYVGEYDFERYPLCASCGGELIPRGEKLCPCCGQKIEWED